MKAKCEFCNTRVPAQKLALHQKRCTRSRKALKKEWLKHEAEKAAAVEEIEGVEEETPDETVPEGDQIPDGANPQLEPAITVDAKTLQAKSNSELKELCKQRRLADYENLSRKKLIKLILGE